MLENEGVYVLGDSKIPSVAIPVVSVGGELYSVILDSKLDPERFLPTCTFSGPIKQAIVAPAG